jgi:hypothetical protein
VSDVDKLPPTQYLLLEVLAARMRLGESYWTFSDCCMPAARKLEERGLITTRSGPAPKAFEARFTDAGRAACLFRTYVSPTEAPIARVRKLCEAATDDGQDLMRLAPSQILAALDGRMG